MDLKIKDVADLLSISETTVRRWVADGKMPAYRLNHQYRFSRTEIENWVISRKLKQDKEHLPFAEEIAVKDLTDTDSERVLKGGMKQFSLYRAIHKGGVYHQVQGESKEEVICSTMKQVAQRLDLDAEVITDLLLDRERLMPTALSNGIGVPHTRDFLLSEHFDAIAVVFPQKPIEYGAFDGLCVHSLFFLFACADKRHLHLLAKLAHLSSQPEALELLKTRPSELELLRYIKDWESTVHLA